MTVYSLPTQRPLATSSMVTQTQFPGRGLPPHREAAEVLFTIATILDATHDNPYRVRAYRRAARLLLRERGSLKEQIVHSERDNAPELNLPGLGVRLRRKLGELIETGRMNFYLELCTSLPPEVVTLMQIPSVGVKTAQRLIDELDVTNAQEALEAAEAGRIRFLYGFGEIRERQIRDGAREVLAGRPKQYAPIPPETEDEQPEPPTPAPLALVPQPREVTWLHGGEEQEAA